MVEPNPELPGRVRRRPDVAIPPHWEQPVIPLRFSRGFSGALTVDADGVSQDLVFGDHGRFTVRLGWAAIMLIAPARGAETTWEPTAAR